MAYACLKCGFVHDGKIFKRNYHREARPGYVSRMTGTHPATPEINGKEYYRKCPDCGEEKRIKVVRIK